MTEGNHRATQDSKPLSIGALSRATRIPAETLRTWERRYGFPVPVRKPSGHRLYTSATVDHLRRIGRLLAQGHRAGDIVGLSVKELDGLLALSQPAALGTARASNAPPSSVAPHAAIDMLLRAAKDLDRETLLGELRAAWVRLGPLRFLEDLAGPLMTEIGEAWRRKEIAVRHEHFASACVSDFLREVRSPYDHVARGPRVVAATLPGEAHEGGLLMASVLLAHRGQRVIYLGVDTPIEQIAAAARDAEAVIVSVAAGTPRARAEKAVLELRESLPARVPMWVGGAGAPPPRKGVERFTTLDELDARLAAQG